MPDRSESDLELARRLEHVIRQLGEDRAARATDKSVRTLYRYTKGAEPPAGVIKALAREAGISTEWLLFGGSTEPASGLADRFVAIPRFPVYASAGPGSVAEDHTAPEEFIMFREDWLKKIGVNYRNCHVITVKGQSMEPTLYEGDIVLVDTKDRRPVPGALFALAIDDYAYVKRVQLQSDGSILLISDNKTGYHRDELIPPDRTGTLRLVGRVRWFGRTI